MRTATEILRQEHDAILQMLEATEVVAQRLLQAERVPPETLEQLLEFFRVFADRCHHGKEEDLLFPLLEKKGLPRYGGPIGVMLAEHDEGRALVQMMAEAAGAYKAGEAQAGASWARAARGYSSLLRAHIDKENNVLFRLAENFLTLDELTQLALEFDKVELEKIGPGTHERLHALMEKLTSEIRQSCGHR